jgi:hypothetical protein
LLVGQQPQGWIEINILPRGCQAKNPKKIKSATLYDKLTIVKNPYPGSWLIKSANVKRGTKGLKSMMILPF